MCLNRSRNHHCQLCAEEALMPWTPQLIPSSSKSELLASLSVVLPVQGEHLWVFQAVSPGDSTSLMASEDRLFPLVLCALAFLSLPSESQKIDPKCGSGGVFSGGLLLQCLLLPNLPFWPDLPHLFPCTLLFINSEWFRVPWRQPWWFMHLHALSLSCWDKASHL